MPQPPPSRIERCILLLCDSWGTLNAGIAGTNRSLALSLTRFKGIKVVSTVFCQESDLSGADIKDIKDNDIGLVTPSSSIDASTIYKTVNENPQAVFPSLANKVPYITHIVGHSPITAEAAVKLKEEVYTNAQVILFYHVIPRDVEWMGDSLPYTIPTDTEQVRLAEKADVVYSVSEKLHWFYTAKFRNRATVPVDHRLFLPQCSEQVFGIQRSEPQKNSSTAKIFAWTGGHGAEDWLGLDIVACAVGKVARVSSELSGGRPTPALTIGGVPREKVGEVREYVTRHLDSTQLQLDIKSYSDPQELFSDLTECSLCIVPSRAEPYGYLGLAALSAGVPTLIAEDSALAAIIRRLTSEPEYFLVPVTATTCAVRQDGSMWRDRILGVLQDTGVAHERARQLRTALRRDEPSKECQDNVISFALGGIRLRHEAADIEFIRRKDADDGGELPALRSFNAFLAATLKQCWRLKHHPLTTEQDLVQLLPGLDLPIRELMKQVTDAVEAEDRRIVGMDEETSAFIVYCPTPDALSDLWAMCDRINAGLVSTLLSGENNEVLNKFHLSAAHVRTIINGPEFLRYKRDLMKNARE